jgi:hypothetical protein
VHKNQIVVCVKQDGKILRESRDRESGDAVSLPFGSEYTVLVKNLNSVRAQINMAIDGEDAVGAVIIGANQSVELERFVKGGNLTQGNRFKFIERSAAVEAHRGIGAEDGLVRVEAWREKIEPYTYIPVSYPVPSPGPGLWYPPCPAPYLPPYRPRPYWEHPYGTWCNATGGTTWPINAANSAATSATSFSGQNTNSGPSLRQRSSIQARGAKMGPLRGAPGPAASSTHEGITVPGGLSNQQFTLVSGFPLEPTSSAIVLKLRGVVAGAPVTEPITVAHKLTCGTCGKNNKHGNLFCGRCGAGLALA